MKKTKKSLIVILVLVIGIMPLLTGCFTTARLISQNIIPADLIIHPDPANPFQGTWVESTKNYIHVIEGNNGILYLNSIGWKKQAIYIIEQTENGYVTSNNWRIRVDGNILTVENMTYERYIKE
ncbi:MAG: hypothetical protein LBB81_06165 [Treponema sp.]|jgi:hypothetical protein|nr:hypothetical protein [Treponema sp.]